MNRGLRPSGTGLRIAAALAIAALLAGGCGKKAPEKRPRLLFFGLDAATWTVITPMVQAGELPTIGRLVSEGSFGVLESIRPIQSPPIWITIATGVRPERHGIQGFVAPVPGTDKTAPVTSNMRRVKAFWNILSEQERTVGIVGWWPTWPSEPVNGFMVTDRAWPVAWSRAGVPFGTTAARTGDATIPEFPGRTYPDSLFDGFRRHIVLEKDVTPTELNQFFADSRSVNPVSDFYVRWVYARDQSFANAGLELLNRERPEVFSIYFNGTDVVQHYFWDKHPGTGFEISEADRRQYGNVVRNYYRYVDRVMGSFIEAAGEDVAVLVCSDHGFETKDDLVAPWKRGEKIRTIEGGKDVPWDHAIDGVFILAGPGVKKGFRMPQASVVDVTPTILAYLGLPAASDMDGRPIEAIFEPEFLAAHPVTYVPSYEAGAPRDAEPPVESPMDESTKERLRSLGYIE